MNQENRTLLGVGVAVLVAGALGLYAFQGVVKGERQAAAKKDRDEHLVAPAAGGGAAGFTRLTVKAQGNVTELSRDDDGTWRLTQPVAAGADSGAVAELLAQLSNARLKSVVDEHPSTAALKTYGLDAPRFEVTASAPGSGAVVIQGGVENSFDGSFYVRRKGDDAVAAVAGSVRFALDKSTFDLREKQLFSLGNAKAATPSALSVHSPRESYRLVWSAPVKRWFFAGAPNQPGEPADTPTVNEMLATLKTQRAQGFFDATPAEETRLGLDTPGETIDVTLASGKEVHFALAQIGVGPDATVYARRTDGSATQLAQLPLAAMAPFDKSVKELRDTAVLSFREDQVARIDISPGQGRPVLTLEKDPTPDGGTVESWRVTAPSAGPAKPFKASSLLWAVGSLRSKTSVEEHPKDLAKYGLGASARSVTVFGVDGKSLGALTLGKPVPSEDELLYARGPAGAVVKVESARLADFPTQLSDVLGK